LRRGVEYERELVHRLEGLGFAVLRAPSSGSRTKLDRPDIVAGRRGLCLALEVKSTGKETFYIKKESISQLLRFSERFGATAMVAVKFKRKRRGWLLIKPENLAETKKGYKVGLRSALKVGVALEALITEDLRQYLGS